MSLPLLEGSSEPPTRSRVAALLDATVALSRAESPADLADVISRAASEILGCDAAAVYICEEFRGERGLRLLRERGFEPAAQDDFGWVPLHVAVPVADVARNGEMQQIATREELLRTYPHLAAEIARAGREALATFPMRVGERVTGTLSLAFNTPRTLSTEDMAYTAVLAEQCALALERARLFAEEHAARCRAEALQQLAVSLSSAPTPEAVVTEAVRRGMQVTHTTNAVVSLLVDDGRQFEVVAAPDAPAELLAHWRTYPNAGDIPAAVVVRTGKPCYSRTRAEYVARAPGLRDIAEQVGFEAEAVLPLRIQQQIVGVMSFAFHTPQEFNATDDAFLCAVADLTAQALDRARLLHAEREARAEAERVGAERARDAEELELLYHGSPIGLAHIDRELRYVRVNAVLAALNDTPVAGHIGRTVREVLPHVAHIVEPVLRSVLDDGRGIRDLEFTGEIGTSGIMRSTRSSFTPMCDASGQVIGVNVMVEDVTSRARAERQARESEAALHEAHRRKDEFLATLAHELRNPLAPIRNALEILQLPQARADESGRAIAVIERQVTQMTRLVDDLLDVSRISQGRLELKREPIDLRAVLALAVETSRPQIAEYGHHLQVQLPHEPLPLLADVTRLGQVFANLLNNAAKYMKRGGSITLRVQRQFDHVTVLVEDRGSGIAAEDLPTVFEIFSQGGTARRHARGGLGIGLSLVRRLTEMHGGTVSVQSTPGHGSTFTVNLPVHFALPETSPPISRPSPATTNARRVLIVDDNVDAADTLGALLTAASHDVTVAHTGRDAVRAARRSPFEVVLLDIGLPDVSGLDVCRMLRQLPGTQGACIVALTGWGQAEDRRQTAEAQFDRHLVKPVHPSVILALLAEQAQHGAWPMREAPLRDVSLRKVSSPEAARST